MTAQRVEVEPAAAQEGFSSLDFRNVLGSFATGVTVITSGTDEHAFGTGHVESSRQARADEIAVDEQRARAARGE